MLAAVTAGVLRLLDATGGNLVAGVAGLVAVSLAWLPMTRRWSARAHLCWASSTFLFVVYLCFALQWTFTSRLGPASTAGGVLLWVPEVFAALLSCAYLWELCDALGTENWHRRLRPAASAAPAGYVPMVSLHVPAHNEPPDMVIDTLRALLRLDYPRFEIILIDDNTDDEDLWRPVQAWCARHGIKFEHLENWPGYKSGALNYALRELTHPDAEIIGVIDSDYQVEPGFLSKCAPSRCSRCSPARRPSCERRRQGSRPPGGTRCAPTGRRPHSRYSEPDTLTHRERHRDNHHQPAGHLTARDFHGTLSAYREGETPDRSGEKWTAAGRAGLPAHPPPPVRPSSSERSVASAAAAWCCWPVVSNRDRVRFREAPHDRYA